MILIICIIHIIFWDFKFKKVQCGYRLFNKFKNVI